MTLHNPTSSATASTATTTKQIVLRHVSIILIVRETEQEKNQSLESFFFEKLKLKINQLGEG